jgi:hypothetical protein
MLSEDVIEALSLPGYHVDEYNSTAMQSFWCIIEPLLDAFSPKVICEIGAERGITTATLLAYAQCHDAIVHSVDPASTIGREALPQLIAFALTSEAYLREHQADFYLIDGDHNFATVRSELRGIEHQWNRKDPLCILCHDVGWPWGRRDMYYDPARIAEPHPHAYNRALVLEHSALTAFGFANGDSYAMAEHYGGEANGVLTAIESFIAESSTKWRYIFLPSCYGMGILWPDEVISNGQRTVLAQIENAAQQLGPLLSILEANRLRLYQGLMEHLPLPDQLERCHAELRLYRDTPIIGRLSRASGKLYQALKSLCGLP